MVNDDIYLEAAEKLGYPGSASCIKFLRVLFTPEEGDLTPQNNPGIMFLFKLHKMTDCIT